MTPQEEQVAKTKAVYTRLSHQHAILQAKLNRRTRAVSRHRLLARLVAFRRVERLDDEFYALGLMVEAARLNYEAALAELSS